MTPEERAELVYGQCDGRSARAENLARLAAAVRAAVAEERERLARLVEVLRSRTGLMMPNRAWFAAAIRASGDATPADISPPPAAAAPRAPAS